jgi:uncharacterized membrane protein
VADVTQHSTYHAWLGHNASALRRVEVAVLIGVLVAGALSLVPSVQWEVALLGGWDASSILFLVTVWHVIGRADAATTRRKAMSEDETRATSRLVLLVASVASLFAVAFLLGAAGRAGGGQQVLYVAVSVLTVVLSWTVVNTLYLLRYADLYYASTAAAAAIDFGTAAPADAPDYRDFAYIAFTIGMTYQVSDTTLRDRRIRREVLHHALMSYVFGVVIVAATVNLVSGLVR